MAFVLSVPQAMASNDTVVTEKPSALAMTGDLLLVRPTMLAVTVVGSGIWLLGLPFSLMGGNALESGNALVVQPAKTTFVRCLGCTNPGYKKRVETVQGEE
ncbi:MAG TPA: hypothetical protein VIN71_01215 [Pseudomonadales bacterium]